MKKHIAVFVSGSGSNFQSIIDGVNNKEINAEIMLCVASKAGTLGEQRAIDNGIATTVMDKSLGLENEFGRVAEMLTRLNVDYIILAGFLTILPFSFVRKFKNKIINIHPSLIPKFSGDGFYGMRVHEAVITAGETESGCTVHFVDEGIDTGDIIDKAIVAVLPSDTPETLQQRVLKEEHRLLPKVVKMLCD
ncbi:MAG: phosphoribosylglycinamide formyltransferase [Firmicutes bacterium]|nr:phosphoribosylglycinamide formyltransferase [Bacillota bacterium]